MRGVAELAILAELGQNTPKSPWKPKVAKWPSWAALGHLGFFQAFSRAFARRSNVRRLSTWKVGERLSDAKPAHPISHASHTMSRLLSAALVLLPAVAQAAPPAVTAVAYNSKTGT